MLIFQRETNSARRNIAGRDCKLAGLDLGRILSEVQNGLKLLHAAFKKVEGVMDMKVLPRIV